MKDIGIWFGLFIYITGIDCFSFRLDRDVIPKLYSLKIRPIIDDGYFEGDATIYVRTNGMPNKIFLHSFELDISEASINRLPASFEYLKEEKLSIWYTNNFSITPGEHILNFKYKGLIRTKGVGLLKVHFKHGDVEESLVVADLQPTGARRVFPCFDEPSFKAKFNIRLIAPNESYRAISNMPELGRFSIPEGIVYDFATAKTMSTYLLSFAVTKFTYYEEIFEDGDQKVPLRVYTNNASKENNELAIKCAKEALTYYQNYTGFPNVLPKIDMIEYVRKRSIATESWGLITFAQGLLSLPLMLYDKMQAYVIVSHELAHFWFGNLVTLNWWDDLWLHEGFSTYMSYKQMRAAFNNTKLDKFLFFYPFMEVKRQNQSRPIVDHMMLPELIEDRFDKIVYDKSSGLLLVLESVIGEENFQKVVRKFLKKYAYKTATTDNFISMVEKVIPNSQYIRSFIESFVYQDRFPLISVAQYTGKFVLNQDVAPTIATYSTHGHKWTLPISYITDTNKNSSVLIWFDKDMPYLEIETDAKWIMLNTEGTGIYRVNYMEDVIKNFARDFKEMTVEQSKSLILETTYSFQFDKIGCDALLILMKQVDHKIKLIYFLEFHDIINDVLVCSGYMAEKIKYMNFTKNITASINLNINLFKDQNECPKKNYLNNFKKRSVDVCANWIRNNL